MNNDDLLKQIKNIIQPLQEGQARLTTAVEAIGEGQKDLQKDVNEIKEELALKADKADIQDLKADLMKRVKGQGRRISTLEDELDIPHPQKN